MVSIDYAQGPRIVATSSAKVEDYGNSSKQAPEAESEGRESMGRSEREKTSRVA